VPPKKKAKTGPSGAGAATLAQKDKIVSALSLRDLKLVDEVDCVGESSTEWPCHLGGGAFGQVYKCMGSIDSGRYAVKVVDKEMIKWQRGPEELSRAWKEIAILSKIDHPNTVRYFSTICC
jgi:hypothetical protein